MLSLLDSFDTYVLVCLEVELQLNRYRRLSRMFLRLKLGIGIHGPSFRHPLPPKSIMELRAQHEQCCEDSMDLLRLSLRENAKLVRG